MKIIKILVISSNFDGIGYYRINSPYLSIDDEQLDIKFLPMSDFTFKMDENTLKEFEFIVYHKTLPLKSINEVDEFLRIKNKYNIKLIIDIDDYWDLDPTHIYYETNNIDNRLEKLINNIRLADYVTTTTPFLASVIKNYNKNVVIFENAVNIKEQQWIPRKIDSDKTRFLWGGSITHYNDLKLMDYAFGNIEDELFKKIQVYIAGFDLRIKDSNNNFRITNPNNNPWTEFEKIFTNNYKNIKNNDYLKWLKTFNDGEDLYGYNEEFKNEFYQRRWTKPIFQYGEMYNEADVALAPLVNNTFNNMKSQLKVIEAGIHKCPIIASKNPPYIIDVINGKHGFLIDDMNKQEWYNKIKFFVENPNAIVDMGESLNELILEKYTLDKINEKRIEFFKMIAD